ncbi:D-hexose-6-phosphate mutarotase [Chitiniphilus eburneus]|nr:D-hexose-6-phosphate mutarotase [Chitiniphilus eburneus]
MQTLSAFDSRLADVAGVSVANSTEIHGGDGAGLPMLVVENALGRAELTLQGAHLTSFVPAGGHDLLWLSPKATFVPGKAVRGGIPLCLPWFGGHPEGKPAHGFARNHTWTLVGAEALADGTTRVTLELLPSDATRALWPDDFVARLAVTVGGSLTLALRFEHRGDHEVPFSSAFHTYFAVPDVAQADIEGLDGCTFINTVGGANTRQPQQGTLRLDGPTDRVYLDVPAVQAIRTAQGTTRIESDTRSAVVWNPAEFALNIADVGDAYRHFVCVERGDVFDDARPLAAGGVYEKWLTLSLA